MYSGSCQLLYNRGLLDMNYFKSCCHVPALQRALAFMCMSMIGFILLYSYLPMLCKGSLGSKYRVSTMQILPLHSAYI